MSDRLLYALSSRGSFKVDDFYDLLSREWNALDGDESAVQTDKRLECLRLLEALCFVEVDWAQRRICAAPTTWALLPGPGLPVAALVGGRSPSLMQEMRKEWRQSKNTINLREEERQWMGGAFPRLVLAAGSSLDALSKFCGHFGNFGGSEPIAFTLCKISSSLSAAVGALKFSIHGDINWRRTIFDVDKMRFLKDGKPCGESRFSAYTNPKTQQKLHVIWRGQDGAEIPRDWGRYQAFQEAGKQALFYNEAKAGLAVPATAPLPVVLLRAIAMCSARLPWRTSLQVEVRGSGLEIPYNIFTFVPKMVAATVVAKAGQGLGHWEMPGIKGSDYVRC